MLNDPTHLLIHHMSKHPKMIIKKQTMKNVLLLRINVIFPVVSNNLFITNMKIFANEMFSKKKVSSISDNFLNALKFQFFTLKTMF